MGLHHTPLPPALTPTIAFDNHPQIRTSLEADAGDLIAIAIDT